MRQTDPTKSGIMPPARGTKTLGWFMEDLLDKKSQSPAASVGRRNSSSDESRQSADAVPSHHLNQHHHRQHNNQHHGGQYQQQEKKQKRYRKTLSTQGAARKDGFAASQTMSESSEDGSIVIPPPVTLTATSGGNGQGGEEYWFYDVATDGYYYEQNGAKGWRRRQPNAAVHKGAKDQEVAHMNVNGPRKYDQLLAAQAAAAQAAFLQQAFQMQQAQHAAQAAAVAAAVVAGPGSPSGGQPVQPTMRYYDPTSDGFYYEMASVDGWKRRQPNKPVSASVPAGITRPYAQRQDNQVQMMQAAAAAAAAAQQQALPTAAASYGAALARGQLPRNTVQQDMVTPASESSRGSASSSTCGDTFAELFGSDDPLFNPVQRPSTLNLEQKAVSPQLENNSNAALFDAVLADFGTIKQATPAPAAVASAPGAPSSQSPMKDSWNSFRSCTLFSPLKPSRRVLAPASASNQVVTPLGDEAVVADEERMAQMLKDLDNLWAPTPVSALNLA